LIENNIENRMFIQKAELFQNTGNIEDIPLNFIAYKIFREGKQCNPYKNNYFEINEEYKKNAQKFIKRLSTTNIMKIYYELEKILLLSPISVIESMVEEVIKFSSSIETMASVINQFHSAIRDIFYFYILNYIIETEINNYKEFNDKIFNVSKLLGLLDVNYKIIKKILRKLLKRKKFYYYNLLEIIIKKEEDMIFYKKIYKTIKNIEVEIFKYENCFINERIELLDKYKELKNKIKYILKENDNGKIKIPEKNNFYNFIKYLTPLEIKNIKLNEDMNNLIIKDFKDNFPVEYIGIRCFILFINKVKVEEWMIIKIEELCNSKYEDIRLIANSSLANIKVREMELKDLEDGEIRKRNMDDKSLRDSKRMKEP
ncbi:hypothetical protein SLOPH_1119, partial [Spraguea lophii 42_110]